VDPRAGLDNTEKRKFFTIPGLELNSDPSVIQPLGSHYADYTTAAFLIGTYLSKKDLSSPIVTKLFVRRKGAVMWLMIV
jgi:hypothetical protein